jgi:hypothetical protein
MRKMTKTRRTTKRMMKRSPHLKNSRFRPRHKPCRPLLSLPTTT